MDSRRHNSLASAELGGALWLLNGRVARELTRTLGDGSVWHESGAGTNGDAVFTEPGQLAQMIDRRGEFADSPVMCRELLTEAGLHRLTAIHISERVGGLCATLGLFHQALGLAIGDASESIDERHITAADTLAGG